MFRWIALFLCLFSTLASAQGYINPPVYATGVVDETRTGTVTTVLKQSYAPGDINVNSSNAITSWTVQLPFPAFDGQLIGISCSGGDITSLSVVSAGTDAVTSGGPTACAVASGAQSLYQFHGGTWTPISFPGAVFGTYTNIKALGAVGNGTTSDAGAFTRAFASTTPQTFYLPPGTYRIPCGTTFTAASSISFIGAGKGISSIRFDSGCNFTAGSNIFTWDAKGGVSLRDLTVDFNNPAIPSGVVFGLSFLAYSGSITGLYVNNIEVLNGVDRMIMLLVGAAGGHLYQNPTVTNTFIDITPGRLVNQSIAFTTNNAAGNISSATVTGNVAVGTGLQFDGNNSVISGNDASGYQFGNGIFAAQSANDFSNVIAHNTSHDTGPGVDSNGTASSGFEIGSYNSKITDNISHDLGGGGIGNFGSGNLISGNISYNIGSNGSGGDGGPLDQAGVGLAYAAISNPLFSSNNVTVVGNKTYDTGPGVTKYGYAEEVGYTGKSTLRSNQFSFPGNTLGMLIKSPNTTLDNYEINARDFGAQFDGVTNDAPAINAAITYLCGLTAGGTIILPNGTAAIASTIIQPCPNIHLEGRGNGAFSHDTGSVSIGYSTRLLWTGAAGSTILVVAPPAGPTGQHMNNTDVTGIFLDCNNIAAQGLDWRSSSGSKIHVTYHECPGLGVHIGTEQLGEFNDPQGNDIWVEGSTVLSTGVGVVCDGAGSFPVSANAGNCSLNQFRHIYLRILNGDGVTLGYSDHNLFDSLRVFRNPGGTGNALVWQGGNSPTFNGSPFPAAVAYDNYFDYVTANAPIFAEGTDGATGGWINPSLDNYINNLDRNNATPFPTAGTGATYKIRTDNGNWFGQAASFGINTDTPAVAWDVVGNINGSLPFQYQYTPGVSCSGTPTSSFASSGGIVTHC